MGFLLEIITPSESIFSGEVDSVIIPGMDGELGVQPGHCPLITLIVPGELCFWEKKRENRMAVGEGFVEVVPTKVSVLTNLVIREGELSDEKKVEEAIRRAEK